MTMFPALLDNLLANYIDRRISQPYNEQTTLEPVWVMPMIRQVEGLPKQRGYLQRSKDRR